MLKRHYIFQVLHSIWTLFTRIGHSSVLVKVLRPGNSEVTFSVFESSCHLLLPV